MCMHGMCLRVSVKDSHFSLTNTFLDAHLTKNLKRHGFFFMTPVLIFWITLMVGR